MSAGLFRFSRRTQTGFKHKQVSNTNKLAANSLVSLPNNSRHRPVLVDQICRIALPFQDQKQVKYLDLTAGSGALARAVDQTLTEAELTLVDADPDSLDRLRQRLPQARVIGSDWTGYLKLAQSRQLEFDLIVADLGWSSDQMTDPDRGFSFQLDGPLDMRYNRQLGLPLSARLATVPLNQLIQYLKDWGNEPQARTLGLAIKQKQPETTQQLTELILTVKGFGPGSNWPKNRIHPATRTFQALRIWVNDEVSQLQQLLALAPDRLRAGGRLAVISFQSLEDRLVKQSFLRLSQPGYDCQFDLITKKPIRPDSVMIADHRQSRSAKLRVLARKPKPPK